MGARVRLVSSESLARIAVPAILAAAAVLPGCGGSARTISPVIGVPKASYDHYFYVGIPESDRSDARLAAVYEWVSGYPKQRVLAFRLCVQDGFG